MYYRILLYLIIMKTNAIPDHNTTTPPQKKLKQARLPFKLISDVSPKPDAPPTRKRKLSVPDVEPVTKVGKLCKENDLLEDSVVISDDESKTVETTQKVDKISNPFVKLVDNALKKKQQKSKTKKKSKSKSSKKQTKISSEEKSTEYDDVEMIEVEVQIHDGENDTTDLKLTSDDNDNTKPVEIVDKDKSPQHEPDKTLNGDTTTKQSLETPENSIELKSEVICLEDSNQSADVKNTETDDKEIESEPMQLISDDDEKKITNKDNNKIQESVEKEIKAIEKPVTPKRSARNKAKADEKLNLNSSTTSSKLDDSVSSDPTTPKQKTRSSSITNSQEDESMNVSATSAANMTPKQLQKRLESAKKKEEREKEKQEREKKRQLEKEERAKQRQEKDEQRKRERDEKEEAKKKEKEEKEEQKKKEREEKEKMKELEKKAKEMKEEQKRKEKEDKEEQRKKEKEAKEEERRKKQEALELEKQEQELKKKKAAKAFVNFFVPKQKVENGQTAAPVSKNSMLSSFTIKCDMRLAPTVRVDLSDEQRESLDKVLNEQDGSETVLYLKCLKEGTAKPLSSGKTWPLSDKDDDVVMIIEDELPPIDGISEIVTCEETAREKLRPKLLSFHENRRPPYWGTWRKKSSYVKPRRPFAQDEKQLEYEGDSDEEWEEEQEGESLDGSACGSDEEGDARDDYEVDNEVFVPHGYLSDEEATMEEDDNVLSLSPETQKARLKYLEDEFESEMKKPTEKLKPRLYGLLWETKEGGKPSECIDALWNYFGKFAVILNDPLPLLQPSKEPEEAEKKKVKKKKVVTEGEEQSPKTEKKKRSRPENKESKKPKPDAKKTAPNQPGINSFLTKLKNT